MTLVCLLMIRQTTNHECAMRCIIHRTQRMVVWCVHKNDNEGYRTTRYICSRVNDPQAGARKYCRSVLSACTGKVWLNETEIKFIALSNKYSRKGEGDVSRNRKPRAKKKYTQVKRESESLYKGSAVAMWKSSSKEWKSGRTSSGIHHEKKSSSLLKVR